MSPTIGSPKDIAIGGATSGIPVAVATGGLIIAGTVGINQYYSPASVIGALLIDGLELMGRFSEGGEWPLFLSFLPEATISETEVAAIFDTTPINEPKLMNGEVVSHGGIQLIFRSDDYSNLWDKVQRVAEALEVQHNVTIELENDNEYTLISASRTSGPISLGFEAESSRRYLVSLNYIVTLRKE
jgi:hypothetical protein